MAEFDQIRKIFSHLHDFIAKHISSSEKSVYGDTLGNGHPGSVSLALQVLFELREDFPQYVESYSSILLKSFKKHVQECSTDYSGGYKQKKMSNERKAQPKIPFDLAKPVSNMCRMVEILSYNKLSNVEFKKVMLQTIVSLMTLKGHSDELYMEITKSVCQWVLLPEGHPNELTTRETLLFLQRLVSLERNGNISLGIISKWQDMYLGTLYHLCTNNLQTDKAREIRRDAFNKVECWCLLGLRARSIQWRHKFFNLHCRNIGRTPYECLHYIFHIQDWEALSNTFWLNICINLVLRIAEGEQSPTLAPNSSQMLDLVQALVAAKREGSGHAQAVKEEEAEKGDTEMASPGEEKAGG